MTESQKPSAIILEPEDGWLTIWFNSPDNRNALTEALIADLESTLTKVRSDRSIRGITLRGKGGTFCSGGDLKAFHAGLAGDANPKEIEAMNRRGGEFFHLVKTMPQVVLALADGAVIAGGLGLLCCADIVVVTTDTKFALTETQLGIVPAQIASYLVQRIGLPKAKHLMLTGAKLSGKEAHSIGLANFVVDNENGFGEVENNIRKDVIRCAPNAIAATKEILLQSGSLDQNKMTEFAAQKFAQCLLSSEGREGILSFMEKRSPSWANGESE